MGLENNFDKLRPQQSHSFPMKIISPLIFALTILSFCSFAQKGNPVLIETFSETGCGACAAYDSAFQAVIKANAEKVVVINYHCYYTMDSLYQYNKICDQKYGYYDIKGFPGAMINGQMPNSTSSHMTYITSAVIDKHYNTDKLFDFDITFKPKKNKENHSVDILINTTSLKESPGQDLRLYVVITEDNIDYEKRFKTKSTNGKNDFSDIMRTYLPDSGGTALNAYKSGMMSSIKVNYTNDDKNIDYKEVQVVVFVRDVATKKILGVATKKEGMFN